MSKWEFVMIFMLVLIGAGVTNMLQGIGRLIRNSQRVRVYWVHCIWLVVLSFTYLNVWYSFYGEQDTNYSFLEYATYFLAFSFLYLLTVLSFPDSGTSETLDLRAHFLRTHRPYFCIWGLVWLPSCLHLLSSPEEVSGGVADYWILVYLALAILGAIVKSERAHALLAGGIILALLLTIGSNFL